MAHIFAPPQGSTMALMAKDKRSNDYDQPAVQGTGQCPAEKPRLARSLRKMGRTLTCPLSHLDEPTMM